MSVSLKTDQQQAQWSIHQRRQARRWAMIVGLAVLALLAVVWDIGSGPSSLKGMDVLIGLWRPDHLPRGLQVVLWDVRLPVALMAVLVGAILIPVLLSRLPSLPAALDGTEKSAGQDSASRRRLASIQGWIDGARFALKSPVVGGLLILDVLMALLATPWVLLPQWSEQVLGGDARLLGMLHAAPAVGAVLAAALSGWTRRLHRPGGVVVLAALCWGVLIAALGSVSSVFLALGVLALAGAVDTIADIIRGALLQQHTPDHLRGRVSALWLLEVNLAPAAGGMLMGGAAQRLGPALTLLAGGACCALGSLALAGCQKGLRASQWSDRALTP